MQVVVLVKSMPVNLYWSRACQLSWTGKEHASWFVLRKSMPVDLYWSRACQLSWTGQEHASWVVQDESMPVDLYWARQLYFNTSCSWKTCTMPAVTLIVSSSDLICKLYTKSMPVVRLNTMPVVILLVLAAVMLLILITQDRSLLVVHGLNTNTLYTALQYISDNQQCKYWQTPVLYQSSSAGKL